MQNQDSAPLIRSNQPLEELLQSATDEELSAVVDTLLGQESSRLFDNNEARRAVQKQRDFGCLHEAAGSIATEICALGSNTVARAFRRGAPVDYLEVVRDVARFLKVELPKGSLSVQEVETLLLEELTEQVLAGKSDEEKEELRQQLEDSADASLFRRDSAASLNSTSIMSTLSAAQLTQFLGGKGSAAASGLMFGALLGLRALPVVGLVSTGISLAKAYKRTTPEQEVIVPVVIQVALIRRRIVNDDYNSFFSELRACL
jgi:uncharacterized protein YaaW (UPF0174 family)